MKLALLTLAVIMLPSLASAQYGVLGVFEDTFGTDMVIEDHTLGPRTVYIIQMWAWTGSTASAFRYVEDPGVTMVRVGGGPMVGMLTLGDLDTGIQIAYQECRTGSFPIYRIDYQAQGTSADCSLLHIEENPSMVPPGIWLVDCGGGAKVQPGRFAVVNPNAACNPDPVAPSTWGRVKALYR